MGEAIYTAGYLGLAPVITLRLSSTDYFKENTFLSGITGACTAGIIAAILTHPIDTAKADIPAKEWTNARSTIVRLYNEQGYQSLCRGFMPRTTRICGAFFICISLREMTIRWKNGLPLFSSASN